MKKFIALLSLCVLLNACGNKKINHSSPTQVIYESTIEQTEDYRVIQKAYYTLDSIAVDTIYKRERSTIETPTPVYPIKDRVDLNEIFGCPDDITDWNFTEIDRETIQWLNDQGIYWDEKKNYWVSR